MLDSSMSTIGLLPVCGRDERVARVSALTAISGGKMTSDGSA